MNNLSVTKANNLIDAGYRLNIQAQKLVLACLGMVDPRSEIPKTMTITALQFDLMGIPNAHRELYSAVDALYGATIVLKEGNDDVELRWIQKNLSESRGQVQLQSLGVMRFYGISASYKADLPPTN